MSTTTTVKARSFWTGPVRAGAVCLALALAGPAAAEGLTDDDCLGCHDGAEDEVGFTDGSSLVVGVDADRWSGSVHGGNIGCTDCHTGITDYPHPERDEASARDYQLAASESCQGCHYAYHTRMLDGMHYKVLQEGNKDAPTCADCHGAHDIQPPGTPRTAVSDRCGACHSEIQTTYLSSVHGKALQDPEAAADVPVCTDCHGAHAIADPRTAAFHASSHEICARCHGDAKKMKPYGLSPAVTTTYLDDFHGRSNLLYAQGAGEAPRDMATCVDCHGVHDIQAFDKGEDPEEMKERVVVTCRKCHEGAPPEFADAWLSHYEPSLSSAPLVWGIQWAYRILIPFIMLGLVLHILLHLWRVRTHR